MSLCQPAGRAHYRTRSSISDRKQQQPQRSRSQQRRCLPRCRAGGVQQQQQPESSGDSSSSSSTNSDTYEFTYKGSDGRMKATIEQAFKNRTDGSSSGNVGNSTNASGSQAPWALGYQMSERYSMMWNDDLKARLLKRVAADELGISDEEMEARVQRVQLLLPDIRQKLASMPPKLVARLAAQVEQLPARLMQLKLIFPGANTGLLAMRQPELVLGFDMARLESLATELRTLLPNLNIDLMVQENPAMLDVPGLKAAMAEAARIMPHLDVKKAMATDPSLIFSFQRGNQLIPYDPPGPEIEPNDDEYAAFYD